MRKFVEPNVADNPLYHDTWKLLKKYRDVVWSLELSVQHVRTKFEIEYGTSIEDFLDSVYLAGADLAGSDIEHHAKCIERSHKMLKLLDSAVELLRTKHKNGEAFMGILDGIVEWIAEQVMAGLDLVTTSVLGALGCDMAVFLRYFPAAETMYSVFVALAIGIILLNWVWQLFKNFGLGAGVEAEDPVKLSIRSVIFILLTLFSDEIVNIVLTIGGTPYHWIMESDLPALSFADFNSVMLVIIGVCANGAVALITLILVLILAWNYLKLLFEAAERYVLLGVLVYTAPVAFSMGASQTTANIWKSWCRMLGGQIFLLVMNAWCLRLFTSMVGSFLANPLSL